MRHDEHPIQVAIADFLRVALPETATFFAVPNGAELKAKTYDKGGGKTGRFSAAAMRLKREGLTPGVADLIVMDADHAFGLSFSRVIALEVKTETGTQSKDQKEWAQKARTAGARYYVVRSIEDAAEALASEGVRLRAMPSTVPGRLYQAT